MNPLVIPHANCLDGFSAAFCAWLKFGSKAEYLPMNYNTINTVEDVNNLPNIIDREVYILDFSFPDKVMAEITIRASKLIWLDHHATSRPYAESVCGGHIGSRTERHTSTLDIVHDNDKSGAMLAWEYFCPNTTIPMLIKHIDDGDRWDFKIAGTKEFTKTIWSYAPWSFAQFKQFLALEPQSESFDWHNDPYKAGCSDAYWEFINEGKAILRAHTQNVHSMTRAAIPCTIGNTATPKGNQWISYPTEDGGLRWGCEGLIVNCPPHLTSDVGHELATKSGTFGLCWYMNNEGKILCSLRCNDGYNVKELAEIFGGGGHIKAAGFTVDMPTLLSFIKAPCK